MKAILLLARFLVKLAGALKEKIYRLFRKKEAGRQIIEDYENYLI